MITILLVAIFVLGYLAITLEHPLKVNKASSALITGVACWAIYILSSVEHAPVTHQLEEHLGSISGILFFLMGAMVVVELIDAHDGFDIITGLIRTTNKRQLLWILSVITFIFSAILDNLTTTIVMISLQKKLIEDREDRLLFAGMTVIAANAGGAWSPIGDVTTTMLWIGGQITAANIIKMLILPSIACLLLPLVVLSLQIKGSITGPKKTGNAPLTSTRFERNSVFAAGITMLVLVPVFKTVTHLPPFMGMLLGLGLLWLITEVIHSGKDEAEKGILSVNHAIRKIDTPSILFFLGILLAISALESTGILNSLAAWLNTNIGNVTLIGLFLGFLSAVVDNVPLVAATQGMYSLQDYPMDDFFWELLAYCTGVGGSALIIGSAAGVAAMGLEKIDFFWYLRKISFLAILGYLSGAGVYLLQHHITQ